MRALTCLILPALFMLGACGAPASETATVPAAEAATATPDAVTAGIEVRDAFIVQPPEGRPVTGGGMYVSVTGGAVVLTGAKASFAEKVEMHTMSMDEGMMQMRQVESFPVSEETPLVLERGGNHLMFFGLQPLQLGEQVDVVLTFTDESGTAQEVVTQAEVIPPAG